MRRDRDACADRLPQSLELLWCRTLCAVQKSVRKELRNTGIPERLVLCSALPIFSVESIKWPLPSPSLQDSAVELATSDLLCNTVAPIPISVCVCVCVCVCARGCNYKLTVHHTQDVVGDIQAIYSQGIISIVWGQGGESTDRNDKYQLVWQMPDTKILVAWLLHPGAHAGIHAKHRKGPPPE